MRPTLILTGCTALALLAGCNYDKTNDGVRAGPQAVHPSTSALAQGVIAAPAAPQHSGTPVLVESYHPNPYDGSQPIVD
ncbi:MAG: hypothetical protein P1U53_11230 [Sulfitobacter sp.]|nr:hypothetical protein [Sulfitobacter sp.]